MTKNWLEFFCFNFGHVQLLRVFIVMVRSHSFGHLDSVKWITLEIIQSWFYSILLQSIWPICWARKKKNKKLWCLQKKNLMFMCLDIVFSGNDTSLFFWSSLVKLNPFSHLQKYPLLFKWDTQTCSKCSKNLLKFLLGPILVNFFKSWFCIWPQLNQLSGDWYVCSVRGWVWLASSEFSQGLLYWNEASVTVGPMPILHLEISFSLQQMYQRKKRLLLAADLKARAF